MSTPTTGDEFAARAVAGLNAYELSGDDGYPIAAISDALTLASSIANALLAVHAELKRAGDQRDNWATQVLDVLRHAQDPRTPR